MAAGGETRIVPGNKVRIERGYIRDETSFTLLAPFSIYAIILSLDLNVTTASHGLAQLDTLSRVYLGRCARERAPCSEKRKGRLSDSLFLSLICIEHDE